MDSIAAGKIAQVISWIAWKLRHYHSCYSGNNCNASIGMSLTWFDSVVLVPLYRNAYHPHWFCRIRFPFSFILMRPLLVVVLPILVVWVGVEGDLTNSYCIFGTPPTHPPFPFSPSVCKFVRIPILILVLLLWYRILNIYYTIPEYWHHHHYYITLIAILLFYDFPLLYLSYVHTFLYTISLCCIVFLFRYFYIYVCFSRAREVSPLRLLHTNSWNGRSSREGM